MKTGLALGMLLLTSAAFADEVVESDDLVRALTPQEAEQPRTRSLGLSRAMKVRVKSKVDLKIPFEFNSSNLAPEAEAQLLQLIEALNRDALSTFRFEIAGHTDASGAAEYNRRLSEARANAVRQFLVARGIAPNRLESVGLGEEELADPDRPNHADNRRVEIRNLGNSGDL